MVATATGGSFKDVSNEQRFAAHTLATMKQSGQTYDGMALELGISKPQVHKLVVKGEGFGPKVETALARKFYAGSVDAFRAAAQAWAERNPDERRHAELAALDPKEAAGVAFQALCNDDGVEPTETLAVVDEVRGMSFRDGPTTFDAWLTTYKERLRARRASRKGKSVETEMTDGHMARKKSKL